MSSRTSFRATTLILSSLLGLAAVELPTATVVAAPAPLADGAVTEDWGVFLGPTHDGVSRETKLNLTWDDKGPKLLWSLPRGTGYASPAIVGGKLVYQHRVEDEDVIECLDATTGSRLWFRSFPTQYTDRYGYNNGPRSSPVIDGDQLYSYNSLGILRCLALADGAQRWQRDLTSDYHVQQNFFGVGTTPLVEGGRVIINVGSPDGACVVALDRVAGATAWTTQDEWGASYASPVPATIQGKRRVLVFAGGESRPATGGLLCIDPATGVADFRFPWRSKSYESVNASCPLVIGNQVLITCSYQTGAALLTIGADMQPTTAWTSLDFGCHFMTPFHVDGYLYGFAGRNHPDVEMACIELATGTIKWHEQPQWKEVLSVKGRERQMLLSPFRGQFLRVQGTFVCLGEEGHLIRYELSPDGFREVQRAWMFQASESWTPPVLWHGLLYLCQNQKAADGTPPRLLCYDLRGK
jgi:outer membrane protein assembly factor BamB